MIVNEDEKSRGEIILSTKAKYISNDDDDRWGLMPKLLQPKGNGLIRVDGVTNSPSRIGRWYNPYGILPICQSGCARTRSRDSGGNKSEI